MPNPKTHEELTACLNEMYKAGIAARVAAITEPAELSADELAALSLLMERGFICDWYDRLSAFRATTGSEFVVAYGASIKDANCEAEVFETAAQAAAFFLAKHRELKGPTWQRSEQA